MPRNNWDEGIPTPAGRWFTAVDAGRARRGQNDVYLCIELACLVDTERFIQEAEAYSLISDSHLRTGGATLTTSRGAVHRFQYRSRNIGVIGPRNDLDRCAMSVHASHDFSRLFAPYRPQDIPVDVAPPEVQPIDPEQDSTLEETFSLPRGWFNASNGNRSEWHCIVVGDRPSGEQLFEHLEGFRFARRDSLLLGSAYVSFVTDAGETIRLFYSDNTVVGYRSDIGIHRSGLSYFDAEYMAADDWVITRNVEEVPSVAPANHVPETPSVVDWEQISRQARDEIVMQRREIRDLMEHVQQLNFLAEERFRELEIVRRDLERATTGLQAALAENRSLRSTQRQPEHVTSSVYRTGRLLQCPAGSFLLSEIQAVTYSQSSVYVTMSGMSQNISDGPGSSPDIRSVPYITAQVMAIWQEWLSESVTAENTEESTWDSNEYRAQPLSAYPEPEETSILGVPLRRNLVGRPDTVNAPGFPLPERPIEGRRAEAIIMDDPIARETLARQPRFAEPTGEPGPIRVDEDGRVHGYLARSSTPPTQ